jgi:hypothetical protein
MNSTIESRYLRRTIAPYIGQIIILSAVTLFAAIGSFNTKEWGLILSMLVAWLLFAFLARIGLKYKISWTNELVCQEASGGSNICIRYSEITKIVSEVSQPGQLLAASRPFRRIAIYARAMEGKATFIDVSLKHFATADVRDLMQVIREKRPDLKVPCVALQVAKRAT